MAAQLPGASFLGIDLSARQIGDGKAVIDQLGLTNIELRHLNILDVDAAFGQFDYIIAHGVYSWVPAERAGQAPQRLGKTSRRKHSFYVSYNTYPGWHMRGMIRDMMLYHSNRLPRCHARQVQAGAGTTRLSGAERRPLKRTRTASLLAHGVGSAA